MTVKNRNIFDTNQVSAYLKRLNMAEFSPDLDSLKKIHKEHLFKIPVENLDFFSPLNLRFDIIEFHKKVTSSSRGGIAIELNILFFQLLNSLRFDCWLISAKKKNKDIWGHHFEHPLILIRLNNHVWLADVGSVGLFIEPKELIPNRIQLDYNQYFRIAMDPDDNYILQQSLDGSLFKDVYLFNSSPVNMIQFLERYDYHMTAIDSPLKQQKVISKASQNGLITLSEKSLVRIVDGEREETEILHADDFAAKLESLFGIKYHDLLHQRLS